MSRRRDKCCCDPCCEPCFIPCYNTYGRGGFGGGNLCWIIIVIIIFCVLCKKDKDDWC